MKHEKVQCVYANPGHSPFTVICSAGHCVDDSHIGVCARCPHNTSNPAYFLSFADIEELRKRKIDNSFWLSLKKATTKTDETGLWIRGDFVLPKISKIKQYANLVQATVTAARKIVEAKIDPSKILPPEKVQERLKICESCPGNHAVFRNGKLWTCGPMLESLKKANPKRKTCGCVLSQKAKLKDETCPYEFWPSSLNSGDVDNSTTN